MEDLAPRLRRHGQKNTFILQDMEKALHVFLRHDAPAGAFHPRYQSPFEVIKRTEKFYRIKIGNKKVNVSIERIKPAYLLAETKPQDKENSFRQLEATRSGRIRKPVVHFEAGL